VASGPSYLLSPVVWAVQVLVLLVEVWWCWSESWSTRTSGYLKKNKNHQVKIQIHTTELERTTRTTSWGDSVLESRRGWRAADWLSGCMASDVTTCCASGLQGTCVRALLLFCPRYLSGIGFSWLKNNNKKKKVDAEISLRLLYFPSTWRVIECVFSISEYCDQFPR